MKAKISPKAFKYLAHLVRVHGQFEIEKIIADAESRTEPEYAEIVRFLKNDLKFYYRMIR